ncbi:hypothetical protein QZH41_013698, partial [Actinostola sp. cb2023]
ICMNSFLVSENEDNDNRNVESLLNDLSSFSWQIARGMVVIRDSALGDILDGYEIMTNCWHEHAQDRPSFSDVIQNIEILMTRDNPYVEFTGINENNECYLVPSFNSAPDSVASGEETTML